MPDTSTRSSDPPGTTANETVEGILVLPYDQELWRMAKGEIGDWTPYLPEEEEEPEPSPGAPYRGYFYPLLRQMDYYGDMYGNYYIGKDVVDPLEDGIKDFFGDVGGWVRTKWTSLTDTMDLMKAGIGDVWEKITEGLEALATDIKDEILGLANFISNIYTWITWNLVDDVTNFARFLFKPITDAWDYIVTTIEDYIGGVKDAIAGFIADPSQWVKDSLGTLWAWLESIGDMIWDSLVGTAGSVASWLISIKDAIWDSLASAADTVGGYLGEKLVNFGPVLKENLQDALLWLWDNIKAGFLFVVEDLIPAAWESASGAIGWLKDEFVNLIELAYDEIMEIGKGGSVITPSDAPRIAAAMFGSAVGFGTLAHGMALAVEAIPNLKYMGVHYLSAFASRMGSFGTISSATMGVIAGLSIRVPFTYYWNSLVRSTIPDERLLIEFRAKRELSEDQFAYYMKYHGYSDEWIAKTDSWLWKDPRLFEILYCADVTVPPREWLVRKFERAGYEDIDVDTLVRVVERRTTRSPRTYYTTSLRRNYRHGFLATEELKEAIEALELAPDAFDWIVRTGELDNTYEVNQDIITSLKNAFRNDLINERDFRTSLDAIGLPSDRINAIVNLECIRKEPRMLQAERKEIEDQWRDIQSEYSKVYITSFRKGLITEAQLSSYLIAIGIERRVAEMTARNEAIKLLPKPKPESIRTPAIPVAPSPPIYED